MYSIMLINSLDEILEKNNLVKYSRLFEDNKNIFLVEEVIICNKDDLGLFLDMFKLESKIDEISQGNFSTKVNNKYSVVFDCFKFELRDVVRNFLFPLKKCLSNIFKFFECNSDSSVYEYLKNVVIFVNFVLLFSPEFSTLYNLKKQIFCEIISKNVNCEDLIFSEFLFVNILNEKFRKCSISWDYRYFLTKNFYSKISLTSPLFRKYLEEIFEKFTNKFNNVLEIFRNKFTLKSFIEDYDHRCVLFLDLYFIDKLNDIEKRNYHLWKYIVHLFDLFSQDCSKHLSETVFIFSFCLYNFLKNTLDYSAYSNLINFHKKLKSHFTREEFDKLKLYLITIKSFIVENEKKKYLNIYIDKILI